MISTDFILESDPVCTGPPSDTIFLEDEPIQYSCEITYHGRWAPQMTWTDSSNNIIPSSDSGTGQTVVYAISVPATPERNGDSFTSTTDFGDTLEPAPEEDEATNVPDYNNVQSFDAVTVHCKLRKNT